MIILSLTFINLGQFLKRASEPYEPKISPAITTPPSNLRATIDVAVVTGALINEKKQL